MRVLIAPDKFKGSLTALEVAEAIREGFSSVCGDADLTCCPIADGGEGTAEVLCRAYGGGWQEVEVRDPLGRKITGRYCWSEQADAGIAALEMSEASGMRRVDKEELDPMRANTFGTGELIRAAAHRGADRIIVGLGGSATNDGGMGAGAALGYRFLDKDGGELEPEPVNLRKIEKIERSGSVKLPRILAAVDVRNPLLGSTGATKVYGPQKGADDRQLEELEEGMKHFAEIVERDLRCRERETEGAGAAGGLGYGLLCFCGAGIRNGFDLVAEVLELDRAVRDADLVITGEGKMDSQTLQGKGPAGVADLARKHGKPVIALAGSLSDAAELNRAFDAVVPISPGPMDLEEALRRAPGLLTEAAARVARLIRLSDRL